MTVNFTKGKFNLREKLKELERPSVDKLVTKDGNDVYIDTITGNTKLESIDTVISDTATDIFIYDTSKDSDGGAWRKRTTHTTWYNETLNTATRGSRREFPAVAVIVAEANRFTIYDGDDPDLPMWMVGYQYTSGGSGGTTTNWHGGSGTLTGVAALNGHLVITTNGGARVFFFIKDKMAVYYTPSAGNYTPLGGVENRNAVYSNWSISDSDYKQLNNATTYSVDMKVFPNAPIDQGTGLPYPSIAIATGNGTNLIKDDGTVIAFNDSLSGRPVSYSVFRGKDIVHWSNNNGTIQQFFDAVDKTANNTNDSRYDYTAGQGFSSNENASAVLREPGGSAIKLAAGKTHKDLIAGSDDGVTLFSDGLDRSSVDNNRSVRDSMGCFITSDYNTGWMFGEVEGAYVATTDTSSDSGEMVTGGAFSDASDWSVGTGWTISGGQASHSGSAGYLNQATASDNPFIQGEWYQLTADVISGDASGFGIVNHHDSSLNKPHSGASNVDVYCIVSNNKASAIWKQNSTNLNSINLYANTTVTIDNVSIKKVEPWYYDRNKNDHHMVKFGTINKSPVATGAELQAFSNFNGSTNYLRLTTAGSGNINFGSSAVITLMGWTKYTTISEYQYVVSVNDSSNSTLCGLSIYRSGTGSEGQPYFYSTNGSSLIANKRIDDGEWHHVCGVINGTNRYFYIDGELNVSDTITAMNLSAVDRVNVGHYSSDAEQIQYAHQGYISLVKISRDAPPSAEQVKKIFEDEKHLFRENAKCSLYGTSNTVTAVAYDEVEDVTHIGTSAGRSDFRGIQRINNTTTPVSLLIDAHDGFIVQQ